MSFFLQGVRCASGRVLLQSSHLCSTISVSSAPKALFLFLGSLKHSQPSPPTSAHCLPLLSVSGTHSFMQFDILSSNNGQDPEEGKVWSESHFMFYMELHWPKSIILSILPTLFPGTFIEDAHKTKSSNIYLVDPLSGLF